MVRNSANIYQRTRRHIPNECNINTAVAPLPGNIKDEVFERYANSLWAGLPLVGALLGNLEGIRLPGHLREINSTSEYLCEP